MQQMLGFILSGLIFALICYGLVRLSMALTLRSGRAVKQEIDATLRRAIPTTATVVQVAQPSGIMRKPRMGAVRLLLTLDVQPAGGTVYQTTSCWQVDVGAVAMLQPGVEIAVTIDADNASKIYPAVAWASYNWS